jgi:hypothetical protein
MTYNSMDFYELHVGIFAFFLLRAYKDNMLYLIEWLLSSNGHIPVLWFKILAFISQVIFYAWSA